MRALEGKSYIGEIFVTEIVPEKGFQKHEMRHNINDILLPQG